jgi:maleamate amidohydrolase
VRIWNDILTERDRQLLQLSGYGERAGFGSRPVVLVIDVNYAFCGDRPEPILESVKRWRNSCGSEAWDAVARTVELLATARSKRIPVLYSTAGTTLPARFGTGRATGKNRRRSEDRLPEQVTKGNEIVAPIEPQPQDIVIRKTRPSVFFGTPLVSYLNELKADTLICCGVSTSGCVRATVVDAFSYGYHVGVVEECTFDRTQASHRVNLFDIHQKYGDVIPLRDAVDYLSAQPTGLFDDVMPALVSAAPPARGVRTSTQEGAVR